MSIGFAVSVQMFVRLVLMNATNLTVMSASNVLKSAEHVLHLVEQWLPDISDKFENCCSITINHYSSF